MTEPIDWERLRKLAATVREQAHAPYSDFKVGAALLTEEGDLVAGANVENNSYGLTQCAERSAVTAAVSAGSRHFVALAIVTDSTEPVSPCGACRQVLAEFPPGFEVRSYTIGGGEARFDTGNLLPDAFELDG